MNRAVGKLTPRHFAPVLSKREAEIAALMKAGTTRRKEIAARLGVSVNTVYSFLARIRLKTGKTR